MTTSRGSSQAGSLMRGVFLFLLIALMLLLVFLTLRSLFFFPTSQAQPDPEPETETTVEGEPPPAGPAAVVPLNGDDPAQGGVSCGRPANSEPGDPFRVQVEDRTGLTEELVVGVALVNADGERSPRQISLQGDGTVGVRQLEVPDSGDGGYGSCVITAIQRGDRVILTGR